RGGHDGCGGAALPGPRRGRRGGAGKIPATGDPQLERHRGRRARPDCGAAAGAGRATVQRTRFPLIASCANFSEPPLLRSPVTAFFHSIPTMAPRAAPAIRLSEITTEPAPGATDT